ncbi:MAG: glycosyltransferase [Flavobacteriales bacterium]|jgi:glycosyltransferase involved in cell wall biosynthesis|nr:glycosyltransferase [Flavobacteriales bacterium]NCG30015.1 glycosyltransferase [Bacteroidota bacterium]MBT3963655.1 glycosyltransferase [Flavobacteriales bacterium]MBT4705316.1 glycosyltransferase [Flavobacteriales bacterium]MBT4929932.1 glycosyltransferase [Flavobacteriales bacterium]
MNMDVIIPALNEEASISKVIHDVPGNLVRNIVVVDNGSSDNTSANAEAAGAIVLREDQKGYGAACLKGLTHLDALENPPDRVAFIDGDYSDYPGDLIELSQLMDSKNLDLVLGERRTLSDRGALTPQQKVGNFIATQALWLIYGYRFRDLGPMRIITFDALQRMKMTDTNYGWTVEMQIKAAKHKMAVAEIPVRYRERIGVSKVSGTIKGSFLAGYKILFTFFKYSK